MKHEGSAGGPLGAFAEATGAVRVHRAAWGQLHSWILLLGVPRISFRTTGKQTIPFLPGSIGRAQRTRREAAPEPTCLVLRETTRRMSV